MRAEFCSLKIGTKLSCLLFKTGEAEHFQPRLMGLAGHTTHCGFFLTLKLLGTRSQARFAATP